MVDNSSSNFDARARLARVLAVILAAMSLGFFLSRFWYELNPVSSAALGDWPATLILVVVVSIFLVAQWRLALRLILPPDAILPVHAPFALLIVYVLWPEVNPRLAATLLLGAVGLSLAIGLRVMTRTSQSTMPASVWLSQRRLRRLAPLALAATVFGVYLTTLGSHVGAADTFEFQVVAPTLGIAHPTGYPLYVMSAKLFSLLPFGSIAFRVNLTSALFATLAAFVIFELLVHLTGQHLVSFIATLAFALSGVMWSQAVVAEVYALNALFVALALTFLVDVVETSPGGDATHVSLRRTIYGLFLILGFGLSHHLTMTLLLAAVALSLLLVRPRLSMRSWMIALGLFALGLSMWLYIPLRWPALHDGVPMMLNEFVEWITGARFEGALHLDAWSDAARWQIVTRFLGDAYGPLGLLLSLAGLIALALTHWRVALISLAAFAAYVFYGLVYFVPDVSLFMIPAFLIMALWLGVGAAFLIDLLARRLPRSFRSYTYPLSLIIFVLLPISLVNQNYAYVDQSAAREEIEIWGRDVFALPIPDRAAILVDSEKIAPLYYLQVTENIRADVEVLVLGTEDEYRQQLDARVAAGQAVYLARFLPNLPYRMRSLGPLVEVSTQIETSAPLDAQTLNIRFGDEIELAAMQVDTDDVVRTTFYWRALGTARPNYHVRLRLIDVNGRIWWEDSGTHPVSGYYPTGAWIVDEVVADYHEIKFDAALTLGEYTLQVGLFPPFRDDGLIIDDGELWLDVATLTRPQPDSSRLARILRQVYAICALDGLSQQCVSRVAVTSVEAIGTVPQSSRAQVRLNWSRIGSASDEVGVSLSLVDALEQVVWSDITEPYAGLLRIGKWPPGVLQATLEFQTPQRNGEYTLRLGMVDESGAALQAKCGWLAAASDDCVLAVVKVEGEAIADAVNFDDQVLLIDASANVDVLRPTETIDVRLNWRSLKRWDDDYTIFVQLIGPDGILHGQVDTWPQQGTLPTSTWDAAQELSDLYTLTLDSDAPSGRYQIAVGWYLLATLRRLPVLDVDGRAVHDRFIIAEFDVP